MNIVNGKFTVVAFTNKYGLYGCIRTPVDKEKQIITENILIYELMIVYLHAI